MDIPDTAVQVLVDMLEDPDVANLRLVSTHLNTKVTASIRSITLRLSCFTASTTSQPLTPYQSVTPKDQLVAWARATQCFRHVTKLRLLVSGKCSTQDWDDAIQEVAACLPRLQALHIQGLSYTTCSDLFGVNVCTRIHTVESIPSLAPIRQHLPHLNELTVIGIYVDSAMSSYTDRLPLAPQLPNAEPHSLRPPLAAGCPFVSGLQRFNLSCCWNKYDSSVEAIRAALQSLPAAFPALTCLELQMPAVSGPRLSSRAAAVLAPGGAPTAETARTRCFQYWRSLLAAAAAAAAALPKLKTLSLTDAPDIWSHPCGLFHMSPAAQHPPWMLAQEGEHDLGVPAAALFNTGTLGIWLLQVLPNLMTLKLDVSWGPRMSWSRPPSSTSCTPARMSGSRRPRSTSYMPAISLTSRPGPCHGEPPFSNHGPPPGYLLDQIQQDLAQCGPSPSASLAHITSLSVSLDPPQLHSTAAALAELPALSCLRLTVKATSSSPTDMAVLVAAAAVAPRLTSLTLLPGLGRAQLAPATFLPLVTRPAAPGSALRELRLVGKFSRSDTGSSSSRSCNAGGSGKSSSPNACLCAWAVLQQLTGLECLHIYQVGYQVGSNLLQLHADCLPGQIKTFCARNVHLVARSENNKGQGTAAVAAGAGGIDHCKHCCDSEGLPLLETLSLTACRVDELHGVRSSRLRVLALEDMQLQQGWATAAAAWPGLRSLRLQSLTVHPGVTLRQPPQTPSHTPRATEGNSFALLQGLMHFPCLHKLEVQSVHLTLRTLQVVLTQLPQLRCLNLSAPYASCELLDVRMAPMIRSPDGSGDSKGCFSGTNVSDIHPVHTLRCVHLQLPSAADLDPTEDSSKPTTRSSTTSSRASGSRSSRRISASDMSDTGPAVVAPALAPGAGAHVVPPRRHAPNSIQGTRVASSLQQCLLQAIPWCAVTITAPR